MRARARYDTGMRSRIGPLLVFMLGSWFALPALAHAAIPFFGPIVPAANDLCPAAWGMVIVVINNIISFALTIAIVFVAPAMIAYAGFLYVVNPVNPGGRGKANKMLMNTVTGIVVALSAWLIVTALLAVLTPNGQPFGQDWATLLGSNGAPQCLTVASALSPATSAKAVTCSGSGLTCQNGECLPAPQSCNGGLITCANGQVCNTAGTTCVTPAGVSCGSGTCKPNETCDTSSGTPTCKPPQACSIGAGGVTGVDASGNQVLSYGSGPCDASTLLQDTNNSLSTTQADTFACIAKYEASCLARPKPDPNYCWNKECGNTGKASTAAGAFQVLLASHSNCYDNSVCEQAAGVSGALNCKTAFSPNGYVIDKAKANQCLQAAYSVACSVTAAQCLLNENGGSFSAWTSDAHSSGQAQCIASKGTSG